MSASQFNDSFFSEPMRCFFPLKIRSLSYREMAMKAKSNLEKCRFMATKRQGKPSRISEHLLVGIEGGADHAVEAEAFQGVGAEIGALEAGFAA